MTNFSRIEMAFELLKASISSGSYFGCGGSEIEKSQYRAQWAFRQVDAFIQEVKNQGNK